MKKREVGITAVLAVLAAVLLLIGAEKLFIHGPLGPYMKQTEFSHMMVELLLFFAWVLWFTAGEWDSRLQTGGILSAVFVFTWIHQSFTAFVISGIYLVYLIALGRLFIRALHKGAWPPLTFESVITGFLMGSGIWIVLVCVLSAFQKGGIPILRLTALATAVPVFALEYAGLRKHRFFVWEGPGEAAWRPAGWQRYLPALILTMLALQAGRMNVALDYDSLHYGLRSAYILDNGLGIYEDLGNINLVYTYSKGFETLILPLCVRTSYSFVLAFNMWLTAGILVLTGKITARISGKGWGLAAAAVVSCIPAVTNMGITAKSDIITLFVQLCILYYMVGFTGEEDPAGRTRCLVLGGCACLFSYGLKPTALVFSTAVYGMSVLYALFTRSMKLKLGSCWWFCGLPAGASVLGLWFRTFRMTGVPVTSVFTSVFGLFGFQVKWPFAFADIPSNGAEGGIWEQLRFLAGRLFHMAAAPVGADMDHVIIAWGTGLVPVLAAAAVLAALFLRREKKQSPAVVCLWTVFLPLTGVCLISIRKLWQVDGNYFMLFYVLAVILFMTVLQSCGRQTVTAAMAFIVGPLLLFNVLVTSLTNWSGFIGFSTSRLIHGGFYNHLEENRERQAILGNVAIWDILASDPRTRVLAFGEHPETLVFPCNVQSYYDLTGSGGNVRLVKTLDDFKSFLRYAKTRYFYIQSGYLEEGSRAYDIVRYMIEDGSLADIRYEYGNIIATVNLDGASPVTPEESLDEFYKSYRLKSKE